MSFHLEGTKKTHFKPLKLLSTVAFGFDILEHSNHNS